MLIFQPNVIIKSSQIGQEKHPIWQRCLNDVKSSQIERQKLPNLAILKKINETNWKRGGHGT